MAEAGAGGCARAGDRPRRTERGNPAIRGAAGRLGRRRGADLGIPVDGAEESLVRGIRRLTRQTANQSAPAPRAAPAVWGQSYPQSAPDRACEGKSGRLSARAV